LNKIQNLIYELETLASYEPEDLDNPEFEIAYENESGLEGFATVCCVDLAKRSLEMIKDIEHLINPDLFDQTITDSKQPEKGSATCLKSPKNTA